MNKIKVLLSLLLVFVLFLCGCQKTIHEHVYDKSIVVFEPTCSKLGKVIKQCECGEVIVDSLDTVGHSFQNGECIYCHVSSVYLCEHKVVGGETVPSTCSQKGSIGKSYCSICGLIFLQEEKLPLLPHTLVVEPEVLATNYEDGHTEGEYCSVCGKVTKAPRVLLAKGSEGLLIERIDNNSCLIKGIDNKEETTLYIPQYVDGLKVVGISNNAFQNNKTLKEIFISNGVTTIGNSAFAGCKSIEKITFPETLETIGLGSFQSCESLENVVFPNKLKRIGCDAFYNCKNMKTVIFNEGLECIGTNSFSGCSSVEEINLPGSLKQFDGCNQHKSLYRNPFYNCTSLRKLTIGSENEMYYCENDCLIERNTGRLLTGNKTGIIPTNVKVIISGAFSGLDSVERIVVPEGVETIEKIAFDIKYTTIVLPSSLKSLDLFAFDNQSLVIKNIEYCGTVSEFKLLVPGKTQNTYINFHVICDDGDLNYIHGLIEE